MTNERLNQKARCPKCKKQLDGASDLDGDVNKPQTGDLSVCLYCHAVLEFMDNLFLEEISDETLSRLDTDTLMMISAIANAAVFIKERLKKEK